MWRCFLTISLIALCCIESVFAANLTGWGRAKFGMTKAEIKRLFGKRIQESSLGEDSIIYINGVKYSSKLGLTISSYYVDGLDFKIIFNFGEKTGKLRSVNLIEPKLIRDDLFSNDNTTESDIGVKCEKLHVDLIKQFGNPAYRTLGEMTGDVFIANNGIIEYYVGGKSISKELTSIGCSVVYSQKYDLRQEY